MDITTTPVHTFNLPIDTSLLAKIKVTYRQGGYKRLEKLYENGVLPDGMTLDENTVIILLTQEETRLFSAGEAEVQIKVKSLDSKVNASQKFKFKVSDVLDNEIL